jgi:hypothetical protein
MAEEGSTPAWPGTQQDPDLQPFLFFNDQEYSNVTLILVPEVVPEEGGSTCVMSGKGSSNTAGCEAGLRAIFPCLHYRVTTSTR